MRFINYERYTDNKTEHPTNADIKTSPDSYRQNNVTFVENNKTGNVAPVMWNLGLLCIKTIKNINEGDDIYVCYGERYNYCHE